MTPHQLKEQLRADLYTKMNNNELNELFDSPQGKKALKSYMKKSSMQAFGDPSKIARNQKRRRGMDLVHTNYSGELKSAMNMKKSKKQKLGKPVRRDTIKGIIRGAKVGAEGISNVVGGGIEAIKGSIPGLRRLYGGARHTATGVKMMGQHTAREIRPQVRKRPLTALALAAGMGVAGAYGASKAYQWWNQPTKTKQVKQHPRVFQGGGGIGEP